MNERYKFVISTPSRTIPLVSDDAMPARSPDRWVILLLTHSGNAAIDIGDDRYDLCRQEFFFIPPAQFIRLHSKSDDFRCQCLAFDIDFMADFPLLMNPDLFQVINLCPSIHISEASFGLLKRYFDFISERGSDETSHQNVVKGLLFSLANEITLLCIGRNVSAEYDRSGRLVDRFFSLLHIHHKEQRSARFYADALCVSDKHLMRSIKKKTGHTFHHWVAEFVMREAVFLLRATDKNVIEISEELSFPNSSSFARFFRKNTGKSPLEFRK